MLNPDLGFVLLFVANPTKSAEFYKDILGIEPLEQSPTFALFALSNDVKLGLWSKYTAVPKVDASPGAMELCFPVKDVDALYESLGKKGVTIVQKPTDMDFGRTFVFIDNDGHRIRIVTLHNDK